MSDSYTITITLSAISRFIRPSRPYQRPFSDHALTLASRRHAHSEG